MTGPETTLAIVLGASKWPNAPNLSAPPSFAKSAGGFVDYLLDDGGLGLPSANLLNLFDAEDWPPQILLRIDDFLKERRAALKDHDLELGLIFYYVGHGSFAEEDYVLAMKSTHTDLEAATSLRMVDLARAIQVNMPLIRRYLILDCCFAAAAYEQFQAAPLVAALRRTTGVFPKHGTALLCASGARLEARAPLGETYTMFTGALLEVLRCGNPNFPPMLSLFDVGRLAEDAVRQKYADEAVRPEMHTPEQREGDVALIPLFPNAALRVDAPTRVRVMEEQLAVKAAESQPREPLDNRPLKPGAEQLIRRMEDPERLAELGRDYVSQKSWPEAIRVYRRLAEFAAGHSTRAYAEANEQIGTIYWRAGEPDYARKAWAVCLRLCEAFFPGEKTALTERLSAVQSREPGQ